MGFFCVFFVFGITYVYTGNELQKCLNGLNLNTSLFIFLQNHVLKMVKNGGLCFDLNSYRFETGSSHHLNLKPTNVSWTCDIISDMLNVWIV